VFNGLKSGEESAFENEKLQFLTSLKGDVASVAFDMEPSVKPIVFTRRPDSQLLDPEYLKRFLGEYEGAGQTRSVRLKGRNLAIDVQGEGTFTLLPDRNDGFTLKEQPALSIRFVTGRDGKVDEFALSTPGGVSS
jgi:hypothetical protein